MYFMCTASWGCERGRRGETGEGVRGYVGSSQPAVRPAGVNGFSVWRLVSLWARFGSHGPIAELLFRRICNWVYCINLLPPAEGLWSQPIFSDTTSQQRI